MDELQTKRERLDELQALFAAADAEDFEDEDEDESGVLPSDEVKRLKQEAKSLGGDLRSLVRAGRDAAHDLYTELNGRGVARGDVTIRGTQKAPDFDSVRNALATAERWRADPLFLAPVRRLAEDGPAIAAEIARIEDKLERHRALEEEAKRLKSELRAAERKQDELVARAREKISAEAARTVLLERYRALLIAAYRGYLDADRRASTAAIENLFDKYAVTLRQIEAARADAARELDAHLEVLGYV